MVVARGHPNLSPITWEGMAEAKLSLFNTLPALMVSPLTEGRPRGKSISTMGTIQSYSQGNAPSGDTALSLYTHALALVIPTRYPDNGNVRLPPCIASTSSTNSMDIRYS